MGDDRAARSNRVEIKMSRDFQNALLETMPAEDYRSINSIQDAVIRACELRVRGESGDSSAIRELLDAVEDTDVSIVITSDDSEQSLEEFFKE